MCAHDSVLASLPASYAGDRDESVPAIGRLAPFSPKKGVVGDDQHASGWCGVPVLGVELTGDDCRAHRVAIFKDLPQIQTLYGFERRGAEVIDDEDLGLGELSEEARVAAVRASLK